MTTDGKICAKCGYSLETHQGNAFRVCKKFTPLAENQSPHDMTEKGGYKSDTSKLTKQSASKLIDDSRSRR